MRTLIPLLLAGASACSTPTTPPSAATPAPQPIAPAPVSPVAAAPVKSSAATPPCPEPSEVAAQPDWQGTPLQRAILDRDLKRVNALATGPALDAADNHHETALLTALRPIVREPAAPRPSAAARQAELEVQVEIMRELLNRGANPNNKGPDGVTPLHRAAKTAYADDHTLRLLSLLVEAQADVNARDGRGATALMEAARANRPSIAQFLLSRGADASLTDCAGHTALDIARSVDASGAVSVLGSAQ